MRCQPPLQPLKSRGCYNRRNHEMRNVRGGPLSNLIGSEMADASGLRVRRETDVTCIARGAADDHVTDWEVSGCSLAWCRPPNGAREPLNDGRVAVGVLPRVSSWRPYHQAPHSGPAAQSSLSGGEVLVTPSRTFHESIYLSFYGLIFRLGCTPLFRVHSDMLGQLGHASHFVVHTLLISAP